MGWVLEVDIQKFFDTLDHAHLRAFLKQRVRDGVLLRLIDKWLQAGVMEDGCVSYPDPLDHLRAESYPLYFQTCSCTTCWISGLSKRCDHVCSVRLVSSATQMIVRSTKAGKVADSGVTWKAMLRER